MVGWTVQQRESEAIAKDFIEETILKYDIPPGQLLLHADRGKVMRSGLVSTLLENLNVSRTHSRPYVSNDNPYSESQFRTLKYRPGFPDRFGCCEDSRAFCYQFFPWYNQQHRHSGLGMLTPEMVHFGQTEEVLAKQQVVMDAAFKLHPERFVRHAPKLKSPPLQVGSIRQPRWANKHRSLTKLFHAGVSKLLTRAERSVDFRRESTLSIQHHAIVARASRSLYLRELSRTAGRKN